MNLQKLMELSEEQKTNYWEFFMYEKVLMDTEEDLLRDFEYYSKRLNSLGPVRTSLDMSIQTVYQSHLKSIKRLLQIMDNLKDYDSSILDEGKQTTFFSNMNG